MKAKNNRIQMVAGLAAVTLMGGSASAGSRVAGVSDAEFKKRGGQASQFEACKNVVLVEASDYQKNADFWKQYQSECAGKVLVQTMPDTGFLKTQFKDEIGKSLSGTLDAVNFLQKVGDETIQSLESGIDVLRAAEACAKADLPGGRLPDNIDELMKKASKKIGNVSGCQGLLDAAVAKIKAKLPEARFHLAFLKSPHPTNHTKVDAAILKGDPTEILNLDMDSSGGIFGIGDVMRAKNLEPMSPQEIAVAKGQFKKEIGLIKAEYDLKIQDSIDKAIASLPKAKQNDAAEKKRIEAQIRSGANWGGPQQAYLRFAREKLSEKRESRRVDYYRVLGEAPQLAYLAKANPTKQELAKVWPQMIEDATEELERAKKIVRDGTATFSYKDEFGNETEHTVGKQDRINNLLAFMGNKAVIERMLGEENADRKPTNCAVATGLANFVDSQSNRNMALLAGSMIGGFTAGPRLLGAITAGAIKLKNAGNIMVAAGVGTGAGFVHHDLAALSEAETKAKVGVGKVSEVDEKRSQLGWSLALHPLDYIGVGAAAGVAGKYMTTAFAKGAIKDIGLSADEAETVLRLLNSDDAALRKATKAELDKVRAATQSAEKALFGRAANSEENAIVAAAMKNGMLGSPEKPAVDALQEFKNHVNKLDAADRKEFYARTLRLVEKYSPGKTVTAEQRGEAMKTIMELSAFGVKDEQHIARLVKEWPGDSLKGLRLSVKQARVHFKPEPGQALEKAQEIAHMTALAEMKYGKSLSQLSRQEDGEVRAMCTCAKMCGAKAVSSIDPITGLTVASASSCFGDVISGI